MVSGMVFRMVSGMVFRMVSGIKSRDSMSLCSSVLLSQNSINCGDLSIEKCALWNGQPLARYHPR